MKNKIFIVCAVLFVLGGTFLSVQTVDASPDPIAELRLQIQQLLEQVSKLQAQLAQLQGGSAQWCHDFSINLRIGDSGSEVVALRTALEKEGLAGLKAIVGTSEFNEQMASIVVGFQGKYKDEILVPLGLPYGTGYVGLATRAKLNALYGCGKVVDKPMPVFASLILTAGPIKALDAPAIEVPLTWTRFENTVKYNVYLKHSKGESYGGAIAGIGSLSYTAKVSVAEDNYFMVQACTPNACYSSNEIYVSQELGGTTPSITVLSPNGGETWERGKSYTIRWQDSSRYEKVELKLLTFNNTAWGGVLPASVPNTGSYEWIIPTTAPSGDRYKVEVSRCLKLDTVGNCLFQALGRGDFDNSDNYFSIIPAPQITSPIGDVNQNGTVGIEDSLLIAQYVAGSRTLTADQLKLADVNSDGKVSTNDANIIAVYLVGLLPQLPVTLKVGDVKEDGIVDIADSLFIAQYEAGSRTLTQIQLAVADVNNDSKVTKADADAIANYLVGNIKELPFPAAPLVPSL